MKENIEDKIIEYFDGRLTDSESADLLHRASVSPEIRRLFREHEMLREMAHSAQASAVVRPEIESSLFSRIDALAAAEAVPERRRKAAPIFWTRWRVGLSTALGVLVLGSAIAMGPEYFGDDDITTGTDTLAVKPSEAPRAGGVSAEGNASAQQATPDAPALTSRDVIESSNEIAADVRVATKQNFTNVIRGERDYVARQVANERRLAHSVGVDRTDRNDKTDGTNVPGVDHSDLSKNDLISAIDPKGAAPLRIGAEKGIMPRFRAEDIPTDETNFELSLENSSGFAYPASDPGVKPFTDWRIGVGYFLDANNIVGARLTYGLFEVLPDATTTTNSAFTSIARDLETSRQFSPGIYFTHREYSVLSDRINLDATVGAGYLADGYTLTGELGLRFPLTSKIVLGAAFALTRVHTSARSMDEIMDDVNASDGPVLIEGSDARNTLNGRIQYGLSYQF